MTFKDTSIDTAQAMDAEDPLQTFRERFIIDDPRTIYLDGNSLGRLPRQTVTDMQRVIEEEWGQTLIGSWNKHWIARPSQLAAQIAELVGAKAHEVLIADSTSINLFKLALAALRLQNNRTRIVSDVLNFPSDLYILQGIIDLLGRRHELILIPSEDGITISETAVEQAIDDSTALLTLSHVTFKSAFMYDMANITALAHRRGALVLWDLSHAVGAVPIDLNGCHADLAIGCNYKYLNGGPGSPAFLYVREDLQEQLISPLWGWFGAHRPFNFELDFQAHPGIERFNVGTPPMLSLSALTASLEIHRQAGMERIRQKSIRQTEYVLFLFHEWLAPLGFSLGCPENAQQRGSHISIRHEHAYPICQAMINSKPPDVRVIPDFRTPDNIRMGIAPLYTSYHDIHAAMDRIRTIAASQSYKNFSSDIQGIT